MLHCKKKLTFFVQCIYSGRDVHERHVPIPRPAIQQGQEIKMNGFEDLQKISKDSMDVSMKSFSAASTGFQAIAAEVADYSKKSLDDSRVAFEKMVGAKSMDKAMELQADFAKSSYESMVGEMTKLGEMYADLAKDMFKPYEAALGKVGAK